MTAWLAASWLSTGLLTLAALCLRRRLQALREAVGQAGHEVRGPLCAARLGLDLVGRSGAVPAAQLRALERELDRVELALADLDRGHDDTGAGIDLKPVRLQSLLADCVGAWRPAADARGAGLQACWSGPPVTVVADPVRLAQALENLIANALEHGRGPVSVHGASDGSEVRVEVADAGPGLPAPVGELVRRRRRRAGTERGRGLGIAVAVARAHGGELTTAPSRQGARLVLRLPLRGPAAAAPVSRSGR